MMDENNNAIDQSGTMLPKTDNNWQDNSVFGNAGKAIGSIFNMWSKGIMIITDTTRAETAMEAYLMFGLKMFSAIFNGMFLFYVVAVIWLKNMVWS